jgi:glutamate-5-semialdehyde dehydrogenase
MTVTAVSVLSDNVGTRARSGREAARQLATSAAADRNAALDRIAGALEAHKDQILQANAQDLEQGRDLVAQGELTKPLLERLNLGGAKFGATVEMVRSVRAQLDPLGRTQSATELDAGLELYRVSVPIGVLGVIFESRPDALVQIASLCLKSGNAVLLKGGREAAATNQALAQIIADAAAGSGIPEGWITLLETREDVRAMLAEEESIDLIIPRGSNEFVRYIMDNTKIPVMGHADGLCHVYVDADADLTKAVRIAVDSKIQGVTTCCAAETLLVHAQVAERFFAPAIAQLEGNKVVLRGDERTMAAAANLGTVVPATEEDWSTEYLDYVLSIKVVDNLDEAIEHINRYGSHHTDSIVTENADTADAFLRTVDSASVFHNASTRFADGFRFGLGAEVGISTGRLHGRGPVGLEGLTTYKYLLQGEGQIVDDYEGASRRSYTHRPLDGEWLSPHGNGAVHEGEDGGNG